jgi:hypothetical protein
MPGRSFIQLVREYYTDEAGFVGKYPHPFLVWKYGGPKDKPIIESTHTLGGHAPREAPTADDPLVLEVIKGKQSAFAFGITIGRTENNDVTLRHEEVSRFHAYIQKAAVGYALVDAESKNGTFLSGVRLQPNKPAPLPARAKIGFGGLEVEFFEPAALAAYLAEPPASR